MSESETEKTIKTERVILNWFYSTGLLKFTVHEQLILKVSKLNYWMLEAATKI